jgi:hypothetical protein
VTDALETIAIAGYQAHYEDQTAVAASCACIEVSSFPFDVFDGIALTEPVYGFGSMRVSVVKKLVEGLTSRLTTCLTT